MRGSSPIRRRAMRAGFSFSGSSLIGSIALAALLALGAGCGDDDGPMPTTDGGNLLPDGGLAPVDVPNPVLVQTMAPRKRPAPSASAEGKRKKGPSTFVPVPFRGTGPTTQTTLTEHFGAAAPPDWDL